jgi:two-component system, cell cycle sensor histidine kinase and response regulator CckA
MPTILVAEDDVMVRNILVKTLVREHYEVLEADNAVEALQIARTFEGTINLLVADQFLKTMRARELVERIRQSRSEMKVLQLSGYPLTTIRWEGSLIPGAAFLQKPFLPQVLADKVKRILEPSYERDGAARTSSGP